MGDDNDDDADDHDMGETRGSASSDRRDTTAKTCEYCGGDIDTSDWYPVTKRRDADGSLQFSFFCGEDCQEAWLREHSESVEDSRCRG